MEQQNGTPNKLVTIQNKQQSHNYSVVHRPSTIHQHKQQDVNAPATIYFRSYSYKSFKAELSHQMSMNTIKAMIEQKTGLRKDKQILHLNGKNITQYGNLKLQSNNIIHFNTIDNLIKSQDEQIKIKMRVINATNQISQFTQFKVKGSDKIELFLAQAKRKAQISPQSQRKRYFYLLQSSRLLQIDKTFYQHDISKTSQLYLLITYNELKTRFVNDTKQSIINDIQELLSFGQNEQKIDQSKRHKYQSIENKNSRYNIKDVVQDKNSFKDENSNDLQLINQQASLQTPNFKKKGKTSSIISSTPQDGTITKLKATKPKQEIQRLLNSQEKQHAVFESKQSQSVVPCFELQKEEIKQVQVIKSPILNPMPIKQRRQIKLQIQRLFNFSDNQPKDNIINSSQFEAKEEQNPKSPPTQSVIATNPNMQRMRLSLGARPRFLDQLKQSSQQHSPSSSQ